MSCDEAEAVLVALGGFQVGDIVYLNAPSHWADEYRIRDFRTNGDVELSSLDTPGLTGVVEAFYIQERLRFVRRG